MDTKKIKDSTVQRLQFLISLTLFSFSCVDNDTLYLSKEFQIPVEVMPKREVFKVGDTISININFNKILSDSQNTVNYLFEDYDFGMSIRVVELNDKIKPLAEQPGSIQDFEFLNEVGGIYPFGTGGGELKLDFTGENYVFSSKMILRRSGVFNITFLNDFSANAIAVNPPSGYKNVIAGIAPSFTLVNSGEPLNYHLFAKNTASEFDSSNNSDFRGRSFFPFIVVN